MNKLYEEIFKFDNRGKLRTWRMEQSGSQHRTIAGLREGKLVTSAWTQCEATNVGRSNERDPEAQATFEIEAAYENKLTREYHETVEGAGGGAHIFLPMLAEKYDQKKFEPGFAQPKLDGIRCIARKDGLWTRKGKPITGVPHVVETLQPLFDENPELVLDGELYAHAYKDDFDSITSAVRKKDPTEEAKELARKLEYHVYDLPSHQGIFSERSAALAALDCDWGGVMRLVPTIAVNSTVEFDDAHIGWLEEGYEGSIYRANTDYENKRTMALKKRKEFQDAEFEVVSIEEGLGNWAGVAKRVVCKLPDGRQFGAGIKGNRERAAVLLHEKHKVVTIQYFALTPDGIPRFPVAIKFHGETREL